MTDETLAKNLSDLLENLDTYVEERIPEDKSLLSRFYLQTNAKVQGIPTLVRSSITKVYKKKFNVAISSSSF